MTRSPGCSPDGDAADGTEYVRVKCVADALGEGLAVDWTRGAVFEFESRREAERWLERQNASVPGHLFLSRVPSDDDRLDVDYYAKYTAAES